MWGPIPLTRVNVVAPSLLLEEAVQATSTARGVTTLPYGVEGVAHRITGAGLF